MSRSLLYAACSVSGIALLLQGCGNSPAPSPSPAPAPAPAPAPPAPGSSPFNCESDYQIPSSQLASIASKGLAIDDTTFSDCPSRIPQNWPNTDARIKALRLFRSDFPGKTDEEMKRIHAHLVDYVKANDAKVLVGSIITCSEEDDEADWNVTKILIERLGKQHVLALAVGNELDLLRTKNPTVVPPECPKRIFDGYLLNQTLKRIAEARELLDYPELPVTSVFTGAIIWMGATFPDEPGCRVLSYLKGLHAAGEKHFVYVLNFYPIFDPTLGWDANHSTCHTAVQKASCFGPGECKTVANMRQARTIIQGFTRKDNDRLWIGEIGWSSPMPDGYGGILAKCEEFFSPSMLSKYYSNFLAWNMSDDEAGHAPAEYAFYFTVRDASQFGHTEHFGLIESCDSTQCKLTNAVIEENRTASKAIVI